MAKWECIKRASFDGDIVITDPRRHLCKKEDIW